MPLDTLSLTDIQGQNTVVPGVAGWDATINEFMANMLGGRMNIGLLTRIPNLTLTTTGINLIIAPPGWIVMPTMVSVLSRLTTSGWSNDRLNIDVRGQGFSAGAYWTQNANMTRLNDATPQRPRLLNLHPRPDGVDADMGGDNPRAFPILDGDLDSSSGCNVLYADPTATFPVAVDLFVWGSAWPKDD